jgi:predicted DNA binding CopG/RHH family protein
MARQKNKEKQINVRVQESMFENIEKIADQLGMKVSEYVRMLIVLDLTARGEIKSSKDDKEEKQE